jgi:hypothetical protein
MRRWILVPAFALAALAAAVVAPAPAETPAKATQLFNGKDLTNFYTYLRDLGKNNDPKKVVSVVEEDGAPAIRVSGEIFGCFTTEKEFANYHLVVEYKWGRKTFPPRENKTRDSGILLHCVGEDGAHGGVWMESIECQLIEGGTGDFILCGGKNKTPVITCQVEERDKGVYFAKSGGTTKTIKSQRVNWWGRDPQWTDTLGFRGAQDVEKPVGQWNVLECVCAGDEITNILNGVVVNKATKVTPAKGKILFQSEGAEVFFRKIEVKPVAAAK